MDNDDSGKTIIRPRPGRRLSSKAPIAKEQTQPRRQAGPANPLDINIKQTGHSPILAGASVLLSIAGSAMAASQIDFSQLRELLIKEVNKYEELLSRAQLEPAEIKQCSYILCTVIDNLVLASPLSMNSDWGSRTILNSLHQESSGGEKVFLMLKRYLDSPYRYREMLELFHQCISIGFQGRYRVIQNGEEKLEKIKNEIYRLLKQEESLQQLPLSPHWNRVASLPSHWLNRIPAWSVYAVTGAFLVLIYLSLSFSVNSLSDPAFNRIVGLGNKISTISMVKKDYHPPEQKTVTDTETVMDKVLAELQSSGQIQIFENVDNYRLIINTSQMFKSGTALLNDEYRDFIGKIGLVLSAIDNKITIVGHSDNIPIRSIKYPSNWHLSKARANAVASIFAQQMQADRFIKISAKGSSEPLVANDSRQNRAKNRRVEIFIDKK